ncbi:hypothetical protein QTG54_006637 [Skeletonema marinoi]|uniref:DUF1995 domain-containing protein n=1 Tax=Skeletonema marinoi TaxID=267567 RepID=A0AAD9DEQ5_9STRA|nr:hypothetical protein QTG54_006637 [Skeletonema marinoi]
MMMSLPMSTLPLSLLLLFVVLLEPCTSFSTNPIRLPKQKQTPSQLFLFNFPSGGGGGAKAPTSTANRDSAAINAIKSALQKPRNPKCPLVECEFPALAALNKLGDGSLRSATEAEDANIAFASKLCSKVGSPFGPKVNLVVSSSASRSFLDKVQKKVKGASICSVKDLASTSVSGTTSVFLTPSSKADYQEARKLAEGGCPTVIVNALFKDQKSVPESATMAYFLKPLTYNSQVAGFLVRSYPSQWTVLDAQSAVLGTFTDAEILVPKTNTPDLRASVRLVQKSADEKAIRARSMQ